MSDIEHVSPSRKVIWLLTASLVAAVVLAFTMTALALTANSGGQAAAALAEPSIIPDQQETTAPSPPQVIEQTPTPGPTLSAADLTLTPKTTEKQCFGSAGCHVTVKVEVGYGGPELAPDETWQVTYELTGDESGPIIGSFELTGTTYDQEQISLSTKNTKAKVSAKVTDIEKLG